MHFSERIKAMQASPVRKLLPFSDEAKKAGKKVFHLNIGQPDIKTPDEYFEAVRNFRVETIAYATSQPSAPITRVGTSPTSETTFTS